MIYLYLIDDHPLFINGVKAVLKTDPLLAVLGSANSCKEAMENMNTKAIDIILLDLLMPEVNGITCARSLKKSYPEIKIIALTGELDEALLHEAWLSGMDAILLKYCGRDELIDTIKTVNKGNKIIGKNVPYFFSLENDTRENIPKLTRREEDVLKLLALELSRREVAERLSISLDAVNFHCKNLFKKFNKTKIQGLLSEARKLSIIR
jgi:DNA-binding NarL/FixJ family response regulator